jgi:aminopeptidase-like protein
MKAIKQSKLKNHPVEVGLDIFNLGQKLWPITRSITGDGVRETLGIIKEYLPKLRIHEVPTGTECFDWVIPKEWNIREAYVIDPSGKKIIDFKINNLHILNYSVPVNETMPLLELEKHLYSIPNQPDAIPYKTSYYEERWGFCLTDKQRISLVDGDYYVYIDSDLSDGHLTYGELILPGKSKKEVFISTYVCHPSMANNELSGPIVTTFLAKWINNKSRKYTYRIIFVPETIGSICYLSKNLAEMKRNIIAGFNISCVGDNNAYSYLPSKKEDTFSDKIALHVLNNMHPEYIRYSYLDRGSDERQYCSPGIDLPVASIMRTKYGEYKEYHTSLDNMNFISPEGLEGAYKVLIKCIECIENNATFKTTTLAEPQLGKRNLWPTLGASTKMDQSITQLADILVYSDGNMDLLSIANKFNVLMTDLLENVEILKEYNLLVEVKK